MRKKILTIISVIVLCLTCAFGFVACADKPTSGTDAGVTYYLYENGQFDKTQFITLSGESWRDDDGASGTYKVSGDSIVFYSRVFGSDEELYSGTLSSGKLSICVFVSTIIYYKEGSEPHKQDTPIENPPTENPPDEPIDKEHKVIFDLNYTGANRVEYSTENELVTYVPTRIGYDFNGWYSDPELLTIFDTSVEVKTNGLVLYASWVEATTEVGQLIAPSVGVKDDVFSWNSIVGATRYQVVVTPSNSSEEVMNESVAETSWVLPQTLDAGIYNVKIRAIGDGVSSVNSVYTTKRVSLRVLDEVTGITLDKATSVLSWNEVKNAEKYQIYVNASLAAEQSANSLDMSEYDAGQLTIKIYATREHWLTSSAFANISKMRLKIPEVTVSVDAQTRKHLLTWNAVRYADTYILKYGNKEIQINDNKYAIADNSPIWNGGNVASFTVDAFDSNADYLISSGAKPITINKIFAFSVSKNTDEAGSLSVTGKMWTPVTVSFDLNGAGGSVASQTITTANGLTYPNIPVRNGCIFTGWYTDRECKDLYDFTSTVKNSLTLYAGWYNYGNGTFMELNSGNKSFSSNSSYRYTYFRALSGSQIRIYYYQTSSAPTSYLMLYDATKNEVYGAEQSFRNTSSSMTNFYPTPGHVYYVRTRSTASTTVNLTFTTYPSNTYLPADGGIAIADYAVSEYSGGNNNYAIYGEEYTLSAETLNNTYEFLGWYDGEKELTKELIYTFTPTKAANYTAKWAQYTVTTRKNIESAGTITALNNSPKIAGSKLTVTAQSNLGYDFLGWYDGEKELSKDLSYTFVMPHSSISYTAKWAVKPEMSNYYFTSTSTTAKITGVRDETVTNAVIPDYVNSIGDSAFYNCSKLTSIEIPSSVTSIGGGTFSGCSSLTSITIPFVGSSATATMANKDTLFGYIFGINEYSGSKKITQRYSSDVTKDYYIPNSLKSVKVTGKNILFGAFSGCDGLTSIEISSSVTSIGGYAFVGCDGLTSITVDGNNPNYASQDGILYDKSKTSIVHVPNAIKGKITIPDSVTSIGDSAFRGCSNLTSIEIPNSVTSIGGGTFSGCSSLTSITIPFVGSSATAIEANNDTLFGYIFGINEYSNSKRIPQSYTNDGVYSIVYYIPNSLKSVKITSKNILSGAFWMCDCLTSIEILNGVTSIGNTAFYGCSSLTSITIPNSVTSIGDRAFYGCSSLTSITIPNSVTSSIGDRAFYDCRSLTNITIPNGVASIDGGAFISCSSLTSITVDENNPNYASQDGILYNKSKTSIVYVPKAITGRITIPNSVTSIGGYAFQDCRSLTSITIPNSVTSIGEYAFDHCSNLTSITVDENNPNYASQDGILYDKTKTSIVYVPKAITGRIIISDGVTSIANYAFDGCSSLTSITMPNNVTSIGKYAFYGCSSLTSITILNSVTSIGDHAFEGCSSLTSIEIPNSVTSIGDSAFRGCSGLTIYCEAASRPSGWNIYWNNSDRPVVWDYKNK